MSASAENTAMMTFVAGIGHELRAPLHGLTGLAELLAERPLDDESLELVSLMRREAKVLRVLVDDLLDLGTIQSGQIELRSEAFSPAQLAKETVETLRSKAQDKQLELLLTIENDTPQFVRSAPLRIRQILINFVTNAIRYTDRGSVEISVSCRNNMLQLSVADTGQGIAQKYLATLFDAFTQAHNRSVGSGLGLAISKGLATALRGEITVDSTLDVGSTFTLSVPVEPETQLQSQPQRVLSEEGSGHVLVVDDGEVNRLLAQGQLQRLGYSYKLAESGEKALEMLRTERFDIMLLDWHMPGIDGLETARQTRQIEGLADFPIVMVSASVLAGNRDICLEAGLDDFLPKPVVLADLQAMLLRWVPAKEKLASSTNESEDRSLSAMTGNLRVDKQQPVVDRDVITTMISDLGSTEVVASLLGTALEELTSRVLVVEAAAAGTIESDFKRQCHTMKSTAALFGAKKMEAKCQILETGAETFTQDQIQQHAQDLLETLRLTIDELKHVEQGLDQRGDTTNALQESVSNERSKK